LKITILLTSIGLSLLLLGTSVLGVFRGEAVADRISAAYFTDSIDEYTGQATEITSEECAPITSQISQRLQNSDASSTISELDTQLGDTFEDEGPTPKSFDWLRESGLVDELEIEAYANATALQFALRDYLNFDPDNVRSDAITAESEKSLAEEKRKLERANRLPPGVSTGGWSASHLEKWTRVCGALAGSAALTAGRDFLDRAEDFSDKVTSVVNSDWESDGYDRVSALVAYSARNGAGCGGYYSCATFWIEAATPCEVTVVVEFTDEDGKLVDLAAESVTISKANSRKSIVVPGGLGGDGFYEIMEASCN
tara:strand:+ start:173 stop:1108 length:936 start_codon:yes stop_codon:yes gene_type:complete